MLNNDTDFRTSIKNQIMEDVVPDGLLTAAERSMLEVYLDKLSVVDLLMFQNWVWLNRMTGRHSS